MDMLSELHNPKYITLGSNSPLFVKNTAFIFFFDLYIIIFPDKVQYVKVSGIFKLVNHFLN